MARTFTESPSLGVRWVLREPSGFSLFLLSLSLQKENLGVLVYLPNVVPITAILMSVFKTLVAIWEVGDGDSSLTKKHQR